MEEERPLLQDLLTPLNREELRALLLRLAERDPSLVVAVEAEIDLLATSAPLTAPAPEAAPAPRPAAVDVAAVRRVLRSELRSMGGGRDYGSVGSITGIVEGALQSAWGLIGAGAGNSALPLLETITDEVWSSYEGLDDSDGEGVPLFEGIGAAWAAALLSADVTREERRSWGAKLGAWRAELADYGLEEGLDAAVQAAEQGWDYPPLLRVLQGQDTRESIWEDGPPDWIAGEGLAAARLHVLERQGRSDEYLRFADVAGQGVAYATMLVGLGRAAEAVAYGIQNLATSDQAQALARVLREHQEPAGALTIAERGLSLEGYKASLAVWTADLAEALGETPRALAAAEIGFRAYPTLESYRRVESLAREDWPIRRDALLDHLRGVHSYSPQGQVDVFLHEGLIADAIAAVGDGASHTIMEQVADAALQSHPDWVIKTSRREAESIMDPGKSEYYSSAARWVGRARDAYRVAGREADWQAYLGHLLTEHRRKYRLVPLLKALER